MTDWASPQLDGDLPLDVSIDVEPLDLTWAKLTLDRRRNALETSALTPGRQVVIEQIAGLRMAYERRQTLPMRMTVTVVVRASDSATLERRTRRLKQQAKDLGAELRLLKWEQRDGWLAVLPVAYRMRCTSRRTCSGRALASGMSGVCGPQQTTSGQRRYLRPSQPCADDSARPVRPSSRPAEGPNYQGIWRVALNVMAIDPHTVEYLNGDRFDLRAANLRLIDA
jgi:hypothetical protein